MKKFWNFISDILDNSCLSIILSPIIIFLIFILMVCTCLAPIIIGKIIFDVDNSTGLLLVNILWIIAILAKSQDDDETGKIIKLWGVVGLISFSIFVFDNYNKSLPKNTVSHVPTPSYSYHHKYSSNYYRETPSDSNYRHSDSSSDTMREKTDIPYVSVPENQTIAEKSEEIIAKVDITHEDETFSPPIDEVYLSDDLEYVTSDEQGNKYYINRSFGNYIMTTSFEGTVCHAMFRKILNNGLEVEVSEYEFDQGRVMKKKILAYEDSMIKFRNENGFREIYFSTISGYTSDDSIIVGWGMANFAETHQWKPINDKLYNALYDAAYKRVK